MSRTRNPKIFARMIEDHDALLGPAFAIPALKKMLGRPINIVSENGEQLLNVQQKCPRSDPVDVKFIPASGDQPGHFFVNGQEFTMSGNDGNNCLIHAVMAGAGKSTSEYSAADVRRDIAKACLDSGHPCHHFIRSGVAHNYVEIRLVGAGKKGKFNKFLKRRC